LELVRPDAARLLLRDLPLPTGAVPFTLNEQGPYR
jgi:hypothetical protein